MAHLEANPIRAFRQTSSQPSLRRICHAKRVQLNCAKRRATGVAAHQGVALDCAQSEEDAQANLLKNSQREPGKFCLKSLIYRGKETQRARKDAMPHERGLPPVPPSDFFCIVNADPKTRFCRPPPATRQPSAGIPPIPLTLRHLCHPPERLARL